MQRSTAAGQQNPSGQQGPLEPLSFLLVLTMLTIVIPGYHFNILLVSLLYSRAILIYGSQSCQEEESVLSQDELLYTPGIEKRLRG